ncbi:MAG: ABC transporter permease [Candidatus Thermoplasmatota archaeon]|jgi:ABC-2 type transport system permease protein|nr:ABC transporter permease [Candidatus Thermoplasmatota archaeon]MCL5790575.1 ABC transporter permease [Candidatus Thermoplasmatota archaeon]
MEAYSSKSEEYGYMNDLRSMYIIMKYQVKFYLKTRRFIAMLIIVALITALTVGIDLYEGVAKSTAGSPDSATFIAAGLSGTLALSIGVVAAFFGGDATSIETGTNSGYYIMTQPVRKISILMGRYFAAVLLAFALILIEYAGVAALSQDFYGAVTANIFLSILEALLLIGAFMSLAFLFSSVFKNPLIGILFSVIVFVIVFNIISGILEITSIEPWFILTYGGQVVTEILNPSSVTHATTRRLAAFSITTYQPYIWEGNAIMGAYLTVSLFLSYIIFRVKEVRPQ